MLSESDQGSESSTDLQELKEPTSDDLAVTVAATDTAELTQRSRYILTAAYCFSYIAIGMVMGIAGPTLELIAFNVQAPLQKVGWYFTVRGVGWICGSILVGAFNVFDGPYAHTIFVVVIAVMVLYMNALPYMHSLTVVLVSTAVLSFFASGVDIGANTMVFRVWREKSAPYLQLLHFAFGVGATTAPFVVALVLLFAPLEEQLYWSYWTQTIWIAFSGAFLWFLPTPPQVVEKEADKSVPLSSVQYYCIVLAVAIFLGIYVGAETSYGGWIYTYATRTYGLPNWEAAYLSSAFWLSITGGRLLSVPFTARFPTYILLLVSVCACVASSGAMLILAPFRNRIVLWSLTIAYGLSMASIFGTAFAWPAEAGLLVTSRAASIFTIGASFGEVTMPAIIGWLMLNIDSSYLLYMIFSAGLIKLLLYFALFTMLKRWVRKISVATAESDAAMELKSLHENNNEG